MSEDRRGLLEGLKAFLRGLGSRSRVDTVREVSRPFDTSREEEVRAWHYEGADFDGADLSFQCLIGVEFRNCTLRSVNFRGSDLSYVRFIDCDLYQADFSDAALYATWIIDSDLTKAVFTGSLLSGVRIKDVDITHSMFDEMVKVGRVRKPLKIGVNHSIPTGFLRTRLGARLGAATETERQWDGIYCEGMDRAIRFFDDPPTESWRTWRRREEVAKIIKITQLDNGYYERALRFYRLERRYRRRSIQWKSWHILRRVADYVSGELLWAYGTSMFRPVVSYVLTTAVVAELFLYLPKWLSESGLQRTECASTASCSPVTGHSLANLWDVSYFLATAAFGNSHFSPVGLGQGLFLAYAVFSLVLLSLLFASVARRLANI